MTTLYCPRGEDGYHSVKRPKFHPTGDELICDEHGCQMSTFKPRSSGLTRSSSPSKSKPRKAMKKGKGFAASKAQREKVRGLPCVSCGREASEYVAIDPAHVIARGAGGCDSPDCVVPLCRDQNGGCHGAYDRRELDIAAQLVGREYGPELAHAILHVLSPLTLLERLTGQTWMPDRSELDVSGGGGGGLENLQTSGARKEVP